MNIDKLQQAWNELDARMQLQARQIVQLRRHRRLDGIRARLRQVSRGQWLQLAVGTLLVLWAGGFVGEWSSRPLLAASAAMFHLYGIGLIVVAALQLARLAALDYAAPVVALQQQLLQLRRLRVRCEHGLLVAGTLLWPPAMVIALHALGLGGKWLRSDVLIANAVAALLIAIVVDRLVRRFPAGFERDAAGSRLIAAEQELSELLDDDE